MSTATEQWTPTSQGLPANGVVVMTMSAGGTAQPLKRSGNLWFLPDGSMYVYYTPISWKPLSTDKETR